MRVRMARRLAIAACSALALTTLAAMPLSAQAPAPKLDDPTIVAIFDAANSWDIEAGQLASKKGSTKDVREFATMLVRDHTNVRKQGRDLAAKLKVTPTPPKEFALAQVHSDAMKKLGGLEGRAFDQAFLENEVAFHQAVIDAVNSTLLPALQNKEVKDLVVMVAPAFAAHRDAAKNMLSKAKAE